MCELHVYVDREGAGTEKETARVIKSVYVSVFAPETLSSPL